jgi:hypothetical protein
MERHNTGMDIDKEDTLQDRVLQGIDGEWIKAIPLAYLDKGLCILIWQRVLQTAGIDEKSIKDHIVFDDHEIGVVRNAVARNDFQVLVDRCTFHI